MRFSTSCQSTTSWAPKKLVANSPVANTMTSVRIAPRPGTCTPSQASGRQCCGTSSIDWSSMSTITFRTQIVITSGIQMSRPVIRYFFTASETERPGSRRAVVGGWPPDSVRGHGRFRLGLGLRLGIRLRRVGLRLFGVRGVLGVLGVLALRRLRALVAEVGRVPAAALQLETGRAQQLLVGSLAAARADRERRLRDLLQVLFLVLALEAAVFVDRHGCLRRSDSIRPGKIGAAGPGSMVRTGCRLPCRRTSRPASWPRRAWPGRAARCAPRRARASRRPLPGGRASA